MTTFQRARRPEQREARRQAILDIAAQMLSEMPVAEISLNELSRRVGLAKSNVLRYFETREAVLLELLDIAWREWLDELANDLTEAHAVDLSDVARDTPERAAKSIASSLSGRPLLCELISATGSVLERNISADVAVRFKLAAQEANAVLAALLRSHVPGLGEVAATKFAWATFVVVAGMWPLANPSPSVVAAYAQHPGLAAARVEFGDALEEMLRVLLTGLIHSA